MNNRIEYIDVRMLVPHPDNPRKDLGDVTELADSIRKSGVLQNLTVVPVMDGDGFVGEYRVVIGHRRLAAAKLAGLDKLPCSISDMDYKTQLATMLSENMQRRDLTLVEQVEGIQMMLDLGESVETVSEVTGLSESTVRRRAKLAELPREEFSAAVERGGRLEDYAKLEELTDPEHRKAALEAIGTGEFGRKLERLLLDERWEARKAQITAILDGWAAKVARKSDLPSDWTSNSYYSRWSDDLPPKTPDKPGDYYYLVQDSYVDLYRIKPAEEKQVSPEDAALRARAAKIVARNQALKTLTERAYERRRDFVLGMSESAASKHVERLIRACAAEVMTTGYLSVGVALEECLDMVDEFEDPRDARIAVEAVEPSRLLLMTWYALTEDDDYKNYYSTYRAEPVHTDNSGLDCIYDVLIEMGYELTADEAALRDGSHELFRDEDAAEEVE